MAIDQKTAEAKEFLDRADIVTMKKDIKRLREADAFKESAKITTAPVTSQRPPQSSPTLQEAPVAATPKPNLDFAKKAPVTPAQPQISKKVQTGISAKADNSRSGNSALQKSLATLRVSPGDKTNATEEEKQKIFALESQRSEAEKQIQSLVEKTPALDSERVSIQKEKEGWQNKLNPLIAKSETGSEEERQAVETQRWPIEKELEKIENRTKDADAKYKESQTQRDQLNQKINQIDNLLKEIYSGIEKRTKEAKQVIPQPTTPPAAPKIEKQPAAPTKEAEKPYLKNVPPAAKEKLTESLNAEEQQRRKFLEDIDKWASFNNNQEKQQ